MSLTEMAVRNAKPKDRPFKLTDGGGLHLVVQPAGGKLWRMKYRFAGREKLLSFGPYPTTTLAEARRKRDDAKKLIHDGTDPAVQKRVEKITAAIAERNTFGALVEEFFAAKEANGVSPSTIVKLKWLLTEVAAPLSTRPISQITPAELLDLLKRVEKRARQNRCMFRGWRADAYPILPEHEEGRLWKGWRPVG